MSTNETERLCESIKIVMRKQGLRYRDLASHLELSETSVKRLLNSGDLSLSRIQWIADWLNVSFFDLVEMAKEDSYAEYSFTLEQETYLAKNFKALLVFRSAVLGYSVDDILKRYGWNRRFLNPIFKKLESLGLCELWPGDRLKLTVSWPFRWIQGGPLQRKYGDKFARQTLESALGMQSIGEPSCHVQLFEMLLSSASLAQMQGEMSELVRRYRAISRVERLQLSLDELQETTGLCLSAAFCSWDEMKE